VHDAGGGERKVSSRKRILDFGLKSKKELSLKREK